ncbi:MAG: peptidase M16 [Candidatus Eremiobacter antarcticus]|nr:insulinase family protein [Candidatus Eremiobacteraeota bacterium]MBC5808914.1 insulinase family protein [Candidatus Eremiobacteraeota bacterium]PZR60401.1 MAG: peptidase M16 [Candidatus Eremiobacter sp. RRmetagenome_bin22]
MTTDDAAITGENTYAKTVLDNGVRVISERLPYVRSASIGLWVGVGSSHEEAALRGISHVIEHMLFKGTPKRSARQIAELMDSVGGHLNAFTDKEITCYHGRVVDAHVALAFDVLADMFKHAKFDPDDLHNEQQVILEEIRMYDDSPDELSQDLFLRSVWGGSSLGEPTIGYAATVSAVTRDAITAYMRSKYTPDRVVVTAAGNIEHSQFVALVAEQLGSMAGADGNAPLPAPAFRPAVTARYKDCEQVYILIGAEGTRADDDRRYPLSVLDTILGGGMASRLFQEIREQRGLVYSVYSSHNTYRNAGLFSMSASTSPKNAAEVVSLIREELSRLAADGVSEAEVARAKEHIKGNMLLSLESTSTRMIRLGRSELNIGRHISTAEVTERIEAVSKEQVDALARQLFVGERLALTVLGPVDSQAVTGPFESLAQSA